MGRARARAVSEGGRSTLDSAAFKCPCFCGFSKKKKTTTKLLAFSWLSATSWLRAHVTSHPTPKASHLEPSSPDLCVCVWWGGGYVLNQICTQTEQHHGRLCFGSTCLQACICVGFYLQKLPVSRHAILPSKSALQHLLIPGEGALLSGHHGGQCSAAGGTS